MREVKPITLSIILAVSVLSVVILSVLTFSTADADRRLAQRYADQAKETCLLEAEAQEWLCAFDDRLQAGEITEHKISERIGREDGRNISIILSVDPEARTYQIEAWKVNLPVMKEQAFDNLWDGEA